MESGRQAAGGWKGRKQIFDELACLMQRWIPGPLVRALLIFLHTAIYFAAFAVGASFFWVVDKAALLPLIALSLMASVWASSRVFVEIREATVRVGAFHPLLPRVSNVLISTISSVQILPKESPLKPHFLEVVQDSRKRQFPLGWFSLATLQQIVISLEAARRKRNL